MVSTADGVDPNRNFDGHWGYDIEGSSTESTSNTFRGPSAASEPEVSALQNLLLDKDFEIMLNYHSAAELILYPKGGRRKLGRRMTRSILPWPEISSCRRSRVSIRF